MVTIAGYLFDSCVQAATTAEQQLSDAADASTDREQQLANQLDQMAAENSLLKEQVKELNSTCTDQKGQLEVSAAAQSMFEARESQHQQQLQEQAVKMKERAAELELLQKQLQVCMAQ
jgi:predicted nuclease with TOPRIM domain